MRVEDPERIGAGVGRGAARRPPVRGRLSYRPEVPPLPPHITFEQAKNFMTSLLQATRVAERA